MLNLLRNLAARLRRKPPKKPTRRTVEYVGRHNITIGGQSFADAPTLLRFVNCRNVLVESCTFANPNADGRPPGDGDGHCIQFDKSTGIVQNNVFEAGDGAEDMVSIYADEPTPGVVIVRDNTFKGRGRSASCTSVCIDGPCPPLTRVRRNRIVGARVAVQLAGGRGHVITENEVIGCAHDVEVWNYYGPQKDLSGWVIERSGRVNVGRGCRGTVDGRRVG